MKKYFMFAVVVTAGMLASCSSESLTGSDPKIETPDQADLVPIEIGVASSQTTGTTRGTGTVGGTVDYDPLDPTNPNANIWRGERVNVMMYQLTPTTLLPTFNFTKDAANNSLYENVSMVTPLLAENSASGIAKEPTNPNEIGWNGAKHEKPFSWRQIFILRYKCYYKNKIYYYLFYLSYIIIFISIIPLILKKSEKIYIF